MLVLTRKVNETLLIADKIILTVLDVRGMQVRMGITAPKEIPIYREEVYQELKNDNERELLASTYPGLINQYLVTE